MPNRHTILWTSLAAFASGYFAWMRLSPRSEQALRQRLADHARASSDWMSERWQSVAEQLAVLEQDLEAAGQALSEQLRSATGGAFDPLALDLPESWQLERGEVTRELRGLPRR